MGSCCVSKTQAKSTEPPSNSKTLRSGNDRKSLSEKLGLFIIYDSNS